MSIKYAVILERAENNRAAYAPDLLCCMTTSATLEQTEANIREAIVGHLETLRQFGQRIPKPASLAKEVEVTPAA